MTDARHSRLIFIEGLPGTGKTTLATRTAADLTAAGVPVRVYLEGELGPVDLQWIARMSQAAYDVALADLRRCWEASPQTESFPAILSRLDALSCVEDGHYLVAYTRLAFADTEMWDATGAFARCEIHNHQVSTQEYMDIYRRRWQRFGEQAADDDVTCILDCALLQCHVTELLGHHRLETDAIVAFLQELVGFVAHLNPEIRYIRARDYAGTILATGDARGGRDVPGAWLAQMVDWIERTPYGRVHDLTGLEGSLAFFVVRAAIEEVALVRLGLPVTIVDRA